MILEVKLFPESQEVMDDPEWFFISMDNKTEPECAYARVIEEESKCQNET